MFELFGALFGGAYILGKLGSDNYHKEQSEAKRQKFQQIKRQLTASRLEWDMRVRMSFNQRASYEKITEVLKARAEMVSEVNEDDMAYVFGNDWREIFDRKGVPYLADSMGGGYFPECFQYIHEVAFNLWLSQKGYISEFHADCGYSAQIILKGLKDEEQGRRYGITDRAVEVIQRNIHKEHPEYSLIPDPVKPGLKSWNFWVDVWR